MDILVRQIQDPADPALLAACRIYVSSIDAPERKPVEWLRQLPARPDYQVWAAEKGAGVVGMAVVFVADEFSLLEYLAVDARRRGGGVGSVLFNSAAKESPLLLIEVDPETDETIPPTPAILSRAAVSSVDRCCVPSAVGGAAAADGFAGLSRGSNGDGG